MRVRCCACVVQWMGREDMEGDDEPVPALLTACDIGHLAQRVILQPLADLSDLTDHELQRLLLARDRLHDVMRSLRPRVIFVVNWTQAGQWAAVLCRDHDKLLPGISSALPDVPLYVWKQRRTPQLADATVTDYCYCSTCPNRGKPLEGVKFCPNCKVSEFARACVRGHVQQVQARAHVYLWLCVCVRCDPPGGMLHPLP